MKYLLTMFLMSCASASPMPVASIDSRLEPYVQEYQYLLIDHCPSWHNITNPSIETYTIETYDSKSEEIGACYYSKDQIRIVINLDWWEHNPTDRRELVFHEMAHCFLQKDHSTDIENYMFPILNPATQFDYMRQVIKDIERRCHEQ